MVFGGLRSLDLKGYGEFFANSKTFRESYPKSQISVLG